MNVHVENPVSPAEVRAQRRSMGLKQAALAELLDVNQATVSRWERGQLSIEGDVWTRFRELAEPHNLAHDWPSQLSGANSAI